MPKSKNRRKTKSNQTAGTDAQTNLTVETVEGAGTSRDAKPEAAAVKKKSVGPVEFFQQVRSEAMKITWTSRGETMVSTIMVLIMVAIMSLFFFAVDQLLRFVVPQILAISLV